jgi:riboflavin synthase
MFTGIIEEQGEIVRRTVTGADSVLLTIRGPVVTSEVRHGDSIAVNGVCLTVVEIEGDVFTADVMGETVRRSTLGELGPGDRVNLERAVTPSTRLGGHLVQGHVDAVGVIIDRRPAQRWETVRFALPAPLARYVVEKGSITVDGVSLTVAELAEDSFTVGLIPTTLRLTTLGGKGVGDRVNLEVDVLAKYVERLLTQCPGQPAAADPGTPGGPTPADAASVPPSRPADPAGRL